MLEHYHNYVCPYVVEEVLEYRQRIMGKPFLRQLYEEWYGTFLAEMKGMPAGTKIELGAGRGFFKEVAPSVISTDSLPLSTNDLTFIPTNLPFNAESVGGIFMIDTFCLLPDVYAFLTEANRTLKPGGKIVMVEPASSLWGRVVNGVVSQRTFDRSGVWTNPFHNATRQINSAMTWIVFERDIAQLRHEFPQLSVESITYHTPLRYLLSGGLNTPRSFAPEGSYDFFRRADQWLSGNSEQWSMFMTVVVRKIGE